MKKVMLVVLALLVLASFGLNAYAVYRIATGGERRDLRSVPASDDVRTMVDHASQMVDATADAGAASGAALAVLADTSRPASEADEQKTALDGHLDSLKESTYRLVGASAQLEESADAVRESRPELFTSLPSLAPAGAILSTGEDSDCQELMDMVSDIAATVARIRSGQDLSQADQIRLQAEMTELNRQWTILSSAIQAYYQELISMAKGCIP